MKGLQLKYNTAAMSWLKRNAMLFSLAVLFAGGLKAQGADSAGVKQKVDERIFRYSVKGRVIDLTDKKPLVGVRINLVNSHLSSLTDENGSFEIKAAEANATLEVLASGYQTQLLSTKGADNLLIKMLRGTDGTSAYNETSLKANNTLSVSEFGQNVSAVGEVIASSLAGQVLGINHSGVPGNGATIFLQGLNSLNMNAQPLYVVDGVVWQMSDNENSVFSGFFNDPLTLIDPNDIESISVMKSGTALYGSKGANGVIEIKTKRSRSQATEISASIVGGYKAPFKSTPMMDASQYRLYVSDIVQGMYPNSSAVDKLRFLDDDPSKSYYKDNHNNTDWLGLINDGALTQSYGVNVKGGGEVALMNLSLGYIKSDGNIQNTGFNRYNVRFNSDLKLSERLNVALDVAFTQASSKLYNDGIDSLASPYFLSLVKSPLYHPYKYNNNGNLSKSLNDVDELSVGNPLSIIGSGFGKNKQYGLNTIVHPQYELLKDKLKLGVLFSYAWKKLYEGSFVPDNGVTDQPMYNAQGEIYAIAKNVVKDRTDNHTSIVFDVNGQWKVLSKYDQLLHLVAGYRSYSDTYNSNYAMGYNTGSDNMTQLSNTTAALRHSKGINDNWKSESWYLNADYGYRNRYLLNFAMAMDASSRFGAKSGDFTLGNIPWAVFPSVTAGWLVSSEKFMKPVRFINYMKLSAGYGLAGNDYLPNYASRSYFESIRYRDAVSGLTLANIGNEKLKWETTASAHFSLDMSLLDNRWSLHAEVYKNRTKNLLIQKSLSEVAGQQYYWANGGELQNNGFNLRTNVRILNETDLKVDAGFSIGHYKNKILSLDDPQYINNVWGAQVLTEVGRPAGVFYGYKTQGVFKTSAEAEAAGLSVQDNTGKLTSFKAGDMHFLNADASDKLINQKDRQVIGDPNPDVYGNFTLNVSYRNFSLGALFTYVYGNDVYNALRANLESGKSVYNQSTAMQNRWVAEGQGAGIPRATYGDPMGNARFSDRWIEDGSYLKCKSLTLSYKVPLQSSYLHGFTLWTSVNNLFTLTKYLGPDPEVSYGSSVLNQGIDAGLLPQTRTFYFGINLNL